MSEEIPRSNVDDLDLERIRGRCSKLDIGSDFLIYFDTFHSRMMTGFYERMTYFAQFGAAYQRVTGCYVADSEGLLRIRASVEDLTECVRSILPDGYS